MYTAQVFKKSPGCRARKQRAPDIPVVTVEGALEYRAQQQPMVSRGATVEAGHILRSYVLGDPNAQRRIEEYGKLEAEKWDGLMAPFRPDPWEGRALLYAPQLAHYDHAAPDRRKRTDKHASAGAEVDPLPDESRLYDDPQEDPAEVDPEN